MSRLGKCNNFSGCLLAYRGEETNVPDGQPFVCAECGKPLGEVKAPAGRWLIYAVVGVIAVGLIAGAAVAVPKFLHRSPTAGPVAPTTPSPEPAGDDTKIASPPETAVVVPKVEMTLDPAIKAEVLKRIDLMPMLSPTEKDKLYASVDRVGQMGLVITVPFKTKAAIERGDYLALKDALEKPDVAALRKNPVAAFVILGYADPTGDEKANLLISKDRADAVAAAIRKEIGDQNFVRSVAMGGTKLADAQNLAKNRIAEVWLVLPK
jgi:hypothetical protein